MRDLSRRLALMVLTDPSGSADRSILDFVRAALAGGATSVQLRMKEADAREMVAMGSIIREETRRAGALYFVNDRVDVALATDADGAHLGADDLPVRAARRIVPSGFLLGRSVDSGEEAAAAALEGADYIGVGPVFGTLSKADAGPVLGTAGLRQVRRATSLPTVAIGGIELSNVAEVGAAGADGIAVIRAITQASDVEKTVRELLGRFTGGGA